jgi:uncharacterized protein
MKKIKISGAIEAKTIRQRMVGLLGAKKPKSIYFQTRWGIHTIGMKFPIDVVVLDNKYYVKKIKTNLKPMSVFLWNPKYKNVLELPAGTVKKEKINMDTKIEINTL